jgi:phage N-6-adenine-methyltransferase
MSLPDRAEHTPPVGVVFHEYANIFPMLQGEAFGALRDDIRRHGIREPVVFLGAHILDGRNRYMAARELGIEYPRREFGSQPSDGDDPLAFVVSHNLTRRHLTESQRSSIAARLETMSHGGRREQDANLHLDIPLSQRAAVTRSDAARMMNVSERSVATARKVHDEAPAEIVRAVDEGRISVSLAAKVADLPEEAQAEVVAAAPDDVKEVAREVVRKAHVANNSGNNEWYTPPAYIEAARAVMGGFDLDPASSEIANSTVQAARIFTAEDDGLVQDWPAGRIWMNPPYAQPLIGQFSEKLATEVQNGSEAVVLVNNATETAWFQRLAEVSAAMCFPRGRIRFVDPSGEPSGAPLQGQAVIYCGPNVEAFAREFAPFGFVVRHG